MKGFLIQGWDPIVPGRGMTSTLSRGEALAAYWLYEPQLIDDQPMGVGYHYRAGRYRPGDHRSRPRVVGVAD